MGSKVMLVGIGKQGKAALWDLIRSDLIDEIVAIDISREAEEYIRALGSNKVFFVKTDLRNKAEISRSMKDVDLVIDLSPSIFAMELIKLSIENYKHLVNASYLIDPSTVLDATEYAKVKEIIKELDKLAKRNNITILPEFGLDPGIDLVLMGQVIKELDEVHEIYTYGAGLPEPKIAYTNPLKYKITWNFESVIRAYKRPARVIREGNIVVIPPENIFSPENCHRVEIKDLGVFEAYPNGDIVTYLERFELHKIIRSAVRYTLRWPEHCWFWKKLVDLRFLDEKPIKVGDVLISPKDFLIALLEPQLQLKENERDMAIVRVEAKGIKSSKSMYIIYQLIDYKDLATGFTAMQRTTGFTVSIGAQMILRGDIKKRGIIFPEKDVPYEIFKKELMKRGIEIKHFVENID